ncbi:MAG: hypothetical protein ACE5JD_16285 [Candidatus Methylomirabilia bacterium]
MEQLPESRLGRAADRRERLHSPGSHAVAGGWRAPVEQVVISAPLDPFLSLKALSGYSGLSVRKLRELLADPGHPLPHYRVGGKILVRCSEYDRWVARYRRMGAPDVDAIVADALQRVR